MIKNFLSNVKIIVLIISAFSDDRKDCSPEILAGVDFLFAGATYVGTIDDGMGFEVLEPLCVGLVAVGRSPFFSIGTFAELRKLQILLSAS